MHLGRRRWWVTTWIRHRGTPSTKKQMHIPCMFSVAPISHVGYPPPPSLLILQTIIISIRRRGRGRGRIAVVEMLALPSSAPPSTGIWSLGHAVASLLPFWQGRRGMPQCGSSSWVDVSTSTSTTLACRAGPCSPCGDSCSSSAGTQGGSPTSISYLTAWIAPPSTAPTTPPPIPLHSSATAPPETISIYPSLTGLFGAEPRRLLANQWRIVIEICAG